MKKLWYAFGWFWMALRKPQIFNIHYMKLVEGMMKFLEDTAKNNCPMACELHITKLAEILYDDGVDRPFLHLWCGINETDNPIIRVKQLVDENRKLRDKLSKLQKLQVSDTTDDTQRKEPTPNK